MKVLFIGQNPSKKNTNLSVAFKGTKSGEILLKWIEFLEVEESDLINCSDEIDFKPTVDNIRKAAFQLKLYIFKQKYDKVIVLGNVAEKVLCGWTHGPYFKLPHPSGRNRKLNDKKWLEKELENAREYIWGIDNE